MGRRQGVGRAGGAVRTRDEKLGIWSQAQLGSRTNVDLFNHKHLGKLLKINGRLGEVNWKTLTWIVQH